MSKALKCDRCGRYFDRQKLEANQVVAAVIDQGDNKIKIEKRHWFTGEKYEVECEFSAGLVDLCPECLYSFGKWFNGHYNQEDKANQEFCGAGNDER